MLLAHTLTFYHSFLHIDQVIIVGGCNIHAPINNDSLSLVFILLLDSVGFCSLFQQHPQPGSGPLESDLDIEFAQNPLLVGHNLIPITGLHTIKQTYWMSIC